MSSFFIVAVDEKWGIAKEHRIPWNYPEDFKFFKDKTKNITCVMGYNTYKELAEMRGYPKKTGELLPGRRCMIITSKDIPTNINVTRISSPETIALYSWSHAFIGGVSIYDYAMGDHVGTADYGYVTRIKKDYDCDIHFNNELLEKNFELQMVLRETDELRYEKWIRKPNETN